MRRWFGVFTAVALAMSAMTATAVGAEITYPDAAYTSGTTKIDLQYLPDDFVPISGFADGSLTVSVNPAADTAADASTFLPMGWGEIPEVESAAPFPARLRTSSLAGPQTITLNLSRPVSSFGFELASAWTDPLTSFSVVATFKSEGQIVGNVSKVLPGTTQDAEGIYQTHARFFGVSSAEPIDEVQIVATGLPPYPLKGGIWMAQFRYDLPQATPVVSTPASSPWSLALTPIGAFTVALVIRQRRLAHTG